MHEAQIPAQTHEVCEVHSLTKSVLIHKRPIHPSFSHTLSLSCGLGIEPIIVCLCGQDKNASELERCW